MNRYLVALCVAFAILFLPACAMTSIQPVDGIMLSGQADLDNVEGHIKVDPAKVMCEGADKLPFPTGKLGAYCDGVRSPDPGTPGIGDAVFLDTDENPWDYGPDADTLGNDAPYRLLNAPTVDGKEAPALRGSRDTGHAARDAQRADISEHDGQAPVWTG